MHHGILRECIEQLKAAESSRTTLLSLLREALHEQVSNFKQVEGRLQLHLVKLSVFLSYAYEPCVVNMQELKIEQVRNQLQVIFTLLSIFRSAMVSFSNRVQQLPNHSTVSSMSTDAGAYCGFKQSHPVLITKYIRCMWA